MRNLYTSFGYHCPGMGLGLVDFQKQHPGLLQPPVGTTIVLTRLATLQSYSARCCGCKRRRACISLAPFRTCRVSLNALHAQQRCACKCAFAAPGCDRRYNVESLVYARLQKNMYLKLVIQHLLLCRATALLIFQA